MHNPFVTTGYAGNAYFCDRERETSDIVRLVTNGNNLALISPRRLGKTDLICHSFAQPEIASQYHTFHIDIYATSSLRDLVNVLGKSILETLKPKGRKVWETFLSAIKSLQAELTTDFTGAPVWSIGIGNISTPELTLDEIFTYLDQAERRCVVAIDEFQQITTYPESAKVEALLRTLIQRSRNCTFIFSGSKRHLMNAIFNSPSRPFYQSVITMGLDVIPLDKYTNFAQALFSQTGRALDKDAVAWVYQEYDGVTLCLQRVMNVLFIDTPLGGTATAKMAQTAADYLLGLLGDGFESLLSRLPEKQRAVLRAIAQEGHATQIASGAFSKRHKLLSPSSTVSAVKALIDKDLVTTENDCHIVYDRFLAQWLRRQL